jgi:hypothetical protein
VEPVPCRSCCFPEADIGECPEKYAMPPSLSADPYSPGVETPEPDEAETTEKLIETLRKISETTFKDGGHALRSVHAKSHALLEGRLDVLDGLPPQLAQGIFARRESYPVMLRLSTIPGDILDDSVTVPRGLAIKVLGVEGERLPGAGSSTTQDFLLVNSPAFAVPNARKFLASLKLLAATTDQPQILKKAVSAVLRGAENVVEAFGGESSTLKTMGGAPQTHPLGDTFYTQTAFRYGGYIAKLSLAPVSPELTALTGTTLATSGNPNVIRDAVTGFFRRNSGSWEVRAQLCTDLDAMPVEDASVEWPEDRSPFVAVARITLPPQTGWSEQRSHVVDDGFAFSPWHGLAAHRPLGSINRVRKPSYEMSAGFRAERNGCPIHHPGKSARLPE